MIRTNRPIKFDITFYFRDGCEEKIKDVDEEEARKIKELFVQWTGNQEAYITFRVRDEFHHINMAHYIRSKFIQR